MARSSSPLRAPKPSACWYHVIHAVYAIRYTWLDPLWTPCNPAADLFQWWDTLTWQPVLDANFVAPNIVQTAFTPGPPVFPLMGRYLKRDDGLRHIGYPRVRPFVVPQIGPCPPLAADAGRAAWKLKHPEWWIAP